MTRLIEATLPMRLLTVDTACCIYHLDEGAGAIRRLATQVFVSAATGSHVVEVPAVVRLELLVGPLKLMDAVAIGRVRELTEITRGVEAPGVSESMLTAAAAVRAALGLKTPDAMVVGSALVGGSDAIVGNDTAFRRLSSVTHIQVIGERRAYRMPQYIHMDDYLKDI